MKFESLQKKFDEFLQNASGKCLLIFDDDNDGVCSAVIMYKHLKKMGFSVTPVASSIAEKELLKKVEYARYFDFVVVLDLAIIEKQKPMEKLLRFQKPVMIIDHHVLSKTRVSGAVYLNPRMIRKNIYWPTSYFVYKLTGLKELEWIATLGTVSDFGFKDCIDLLKRWVRAKKKENLVRTKMWRYANLLYSLISVKDAMTAFRILKNSKSLEDFAQRKTVIKAKEKFDREFNRALKNAIQNAEMYSRVMFVELKEEKIKALRSTLAFTLAMKYNKVVIVYTEKKDGYIASIRRKNVRVNLRDLAVKATRGIGSGGGHEAAAGAFIKPSKLEIFKKRVIKFLEKRKSKKKKLVLTK